MASSAQPVTDESTIDASITAATTTTTAAGGMKKIHVPSSDRRLALSAIDNQLNLAKDAWGEKNFNSPNQQESSNGDNNNNNFAARGEFFMNCINQTGASLHRQLDLVTAPAEETEVESVLDSFRTRLATATLHLNSDTNNNRDDEAVEEDLLSSSSSSDDDDDEEDFEFDDADIVDAEAYQQVKQLRGKARDIASRVLSVREETVGRAMEMTQRNLAELLRVHGFDNDDDIHSQEGIGSERQTEEDTKNDKEKNNNGSGGDNLKPLRMALHTLVSSLHHVDSNLGENIESLKETIGTIDSSVEKIQRHLMGDENALSRTEKALLASSSLNPEEDTTVVGAVEIVDDESAIAKEAETIAMMNPDKKLAHLLAGTL